jgi:Peptidase M60, enhancin and enhancin-like/N-terminal domain of M60-like peptidases
MLKNPELNPYITFRRLLFMRISTALSSVLVLFIAACGGGGGSTDTAQGNTNPPPVISDANLDITLPNGTLDFTGDIGVKSTDKSVSIKNIGATAAQLNNFSSSSSEFVLTTSGTGYCIDLIVLKAGESCNVGVAIKPASIGIKSGTLVINYKGTPSSKSFPLSGVAYPAPAAATGAPVTLAGATIDPATKTTVVSVLPDTINVERVRVNATYPWSDYRSTGIYAAPGEVISIAVGAAPAGTTVQAWIGLHQQKVGTSAPALVAFPPFIDLTAGTTQTISSPDGGPIYVRAVNNTTKGGTVKFQIVQGGTAMPFFLMGRDTHAQWLAAINAPNVTPYVEAVSNKTIITFTTDKVKAALTTDPTADIARTAKLFDDMIASHDSVAGLDDSSALNMKHEHPLHFTPQDVAGYYMFAWYYRTAFCLDCAPLLFTKAFILDGWGPWHEVGHMYQGGWEWSNLTEVSVNIYSMEFEKTLGSTNRLIADNSSVAGVKVWDHALQQRPTLTAFDSLDLFERLVMFWQLRLNYGAKFWPALHKLYRDPATRPAFTDDESRRQNFIVMASRAAGQDLRGFLSAWSLKPTAATDAAVQALNLPAADTNALLALRPK